MTCYEDVNNRQSNNSTQITSDPPVIVHDDRVYLFTGHDEAPPNYPWYVLTEWLCFSSADLIHWQEHEINFRPTDFSWARRDAFASKALVHNGKFYLFVSLTHGSIEGEAIGIAVSNSPTGPFTDARGSALITSRDLKSGGRNFDPSVIVDDDGHAYTFWGKGICYYARLSDKLTEIEGEIRQVDLPKFQEGVHIHKRNGWYYVAFGYDFPEKVGYAMSRSIHGPWEFKGILNEVPGNCETNRPGIVDFKDASYFFYHNGTLPEGKSYRRSVCIDRLYYNDDGSLKRIVMTSEGIQ